MTIISYIHIRTYTYIHIYVHTYTYVYTHAHQYTHTHHNIAHNAHVLLTSIFTSGRTFQKPIPPNT